MLLASALITACSDSSAPLASAPDATAFSAALSVSDGPRTLLVVDHAVRDPCLAETVVLSGSLQLQSRVRALDADRFEVRYAAQPIDVTALGRSGETRLRVTGAATGVLATSHRARAVVVADFQLVATSRPEADVHRVRVKPRLGVLIAFPVSGDGHLQEPVIDGVFIAKGDCQAPA